ncbi:Zn-dependent protease [Pannonibacter phragmitetus]|uniref:Zn-dependent protease n=1 Tax=Pannonibacter phragmitetus TaxID=121719 RepID=A0A0L0ISI1_9HYPH|nr:metallopeptidase family protein [Pannonibacter phragmitetus]ALV27047.1 Zn-dependent protease [Pannonibacter phragmitetus]KND16427.1 Zn-dependent protease [Pannonibacter phragmitetus]
MSDRTEAPDPQIAAIAAMVAPGLDAFEIIARQAYAQLPEEFQALCEGVVITVADFADEEMLESVGLEDPFELLGLFQGIGLAQGGDFFHTGQHPNRVWLFRRPILDYWAEHEEQLGDVVTHVLVHEIGHHFGLSDEDMEAIEAAAG